MVLDDALLVLPPEFHAAEWNKKSSLSNIYYWESYHGLHIGDWFS